MEKIVITTTKQVPIADALQYYQCIYDSETNDSETTKLLKIIGDFGNSIEEKKTTPLHIIKIMTAITKEISHEQIEMITGMFLEILGNEEYPDLRQKFLSKLSNLPTKNPLPSIEKVIESMKLSENTQQEQPLEETPQETLPLYMLSFQEWEQNIPDKEREWTMNLEPCDAINYFHINPFVALEKLEDENYRKSECAYRFVPCLNGANCLYSHHPLTREWINSHYDELMEYLEHFKKRE